MYGVYYLYNLSNKYIHRLVYSINTYSKTRGTDTDQISELIIMHVRPFDRVACWVVGWLGYGTVEAWSFGVGIFQKGFCILSYKLNLVGASYICSYCRGWVGGGGC